MLVIKGILCVVWLVVSMFFLAGAISMLTRCMFEWSFNDESNKKVGKEKK